MSKKPTIYNGAKIYDTPKAGPSPNPKLWPGYNGGCENYPTHGIGSAWKDTAYWERELFNQILSVLDFTIPEHWDRDYTLWVLFRVGYIGIIDAESRIPGKPGFGVIPQYCTYGGINLYYQPRYIMVSNPLIKPGKYTLGEKAALIKLTPDYHGVWDKVHYHAEKLAILSQALDMAALNSRIAKALLADNNAIAQALYTIFDQLDQGNPLVAIAEGQFKNLRQDGSLPVYEINQDVGKNYICDKLQAAIRAQRAAFEEEIGLPSLSDKKERVITTEVQQQQQKALSNIDVWVDTLNRTISEAEKVFPGLGFSVKRPEMGGTQNVNADPMEP